MKRSSARILYFTMSLNMSPINFSISFSHLHEVWSWESRPNLQWACQIKFITVLVWQQNPQGFPFARLVSFVVVVEHGTVAQKCVAKRYMTSAKPSIVAVVYYNNVYELCLLCKLMLNLWYCVSFLLKIFGGYWNLYYFCIRFRLVKTTLSNERKSSLNNLHKDRDSSTRSDFNNVEIMG